MGFDVVKEKELVELIRSTFSDVPRPDLTKRFGHALDDEWHLTKGRADELRSLDTEEFWWEVSDEDVEEFHNIIFWGDPQSFRFYYPRFLVYAIEHSHEFNTHVNMSLFDTVFSQLDNAFAMRIDELRVVADVIAEFDCVDSTWQYFPLWGFFQRRIEDLEKGLAHVEQVPTK